MASSCSSVEYKDNFLEAAEEDPFLFTTGFCIEAADVDSKMNCYLLQNIINQILTIDISTLHLRFGSKMKNTY